MKYGDIIQYLERLPDDIIPQKEKLIEDLKATQLQQRVLQNQTIGASNGGTIPLVNNEAQPISQDL